MRVSTIMPTQSHGEKNKLAHSLLFACITLFSWLLGYIVTVYVYVYVYKGKYGVTGGVTRRNRFLPFRAPSSRARAWVGDQAGSSSRIRSGCADNQMEAALRQAPTTTPALPSDIHSHFQGGRWLVHMDQRGNLIFNPVDREAFHVPASEFPAVISSAEFPSSLLPMVLSAAAGRMVGVFDRYQRRHGGPSSATRAIPQAQPAAEASGVLGLQDEAEFVLSRILNHRVRVQPDRGPAFLWSIGELARYGSGEPLTPPGRISYGEVNRALMAYGCRVSEDRQRLLISNTHPSVEARLRDTPGLSAGTRS